MENPILASDYNNAMLTVAWLFKEGKRVLIFGFIELFPAELPEYETLPEVSKKCTCIENSKIFFERINISYEAAISIFKSAQKKVNIKSKKSLILPVKGNNHSNCEVEINDFCVEPIYPSFNLTIKAPYLPYNTQARTSHLYPFALSKDLEKIMQDMNVMEWLEEKFLFSLFKYTEFLGSFHLVAHNPVFRDIQARLVINDDTKESIQYQINFRPNISKETISLIQIEERNDEYSLTTQHNMFKNCFAIPLIGQAEKAGYIIKCTKRGVLEIHKPTPFIRHVHASINFRIKTNEVHIKTPDGKTKSVIQNEKFTNEKSDIISDQIIPLRETFYIKNKYHNERDRENQDNMQKWFTSHDEATLFIRRIISQANKRVWIIDPYFSPLELYKFAFATRYNSLEIKIATSNEFLRTKEDTKDPSIAKEYGEILFKELVNNEEENLEIYVLTGNKSPIHDRFLIIDNSVWMLGNSLNSIGKRSGAMVKVQYPEKIIKEITTIINGERSKEFKVWAERYSECEEDNNDTT